MSSLTVRRVAVQKIFGAFVTLISLGCVAGCGTAYSQQVASDPLIAVGWVQAAGEIRIYARKSDLGRLYDGSCISGVMEGRRTMPKRLQNRQVSVFGKFVDAKEFDELVARGVSSGVENYCNSPKIAIITRLIEASSEK